jgi:MCP family monocarboxylic acid transporter-like MFS transporter 10
VLTFIDASAPSQGVSGHISSYLVAIANAGSGVGRLACGFIADRIGTCVVSSTLAPRKEKLQQFTYNGQAR